MEDVVISTDSTCIRDTASKNGYFMLKWTIDSPGCYNGCIKYDGKVLGPENIEIICLSSKLHCYCITIIIETKYSI